MNEKYDVDGVIFDLDGTIYLGEKSLPGAVDAVAELRRRGKRVLFVSNKPLEPRRAYAQKLTRLDIPTEEGDVITSAYVLGFYLKHHAPKLRLYVIGEVSLRAELAGWGLQVLPEFFEQDEKGVIDTAGVDAVVAAFDRTLDYRKLNTAYQALQRGAQFFATNADKTCPMPGGAIPDAGATIAALEHMTGRQVELLAGKPSALMIQVATDVLQLPAQRCLVVGDRLETDILMGQRAGALTSVVLTGASTLNLVKEMKTPPTFVLNDLKELFQWVA